MNAVILTMNPDKKWPNLPNFQTSNLTYATQFQKITSL